MSTIVSMESISGKATDMAFVGATATLSLVATSFFLLYIIFNLLKHARRGPNDYPTQGIRFLKTQFGWLFCMLVIADWIQAIGFIMNFHWIKMGEVPVVATTANATCVAQGAFIELGDVAGAAWTLFIAAHTFLVLGLGFTPSVKVMISSISATWTVCIILTILGPLLVQDDKHGPFYDFAGLWCFISPRYELSRLYLHYLWLFIACAVNIAFYVALAFILHTRAYSKSVSYTRSSKERAPFKVDAVASKMLAYPIVYLAVVLPLSIYRIAGVAGIKFPQSAQAAVGSIFALAGFANILLYCTTRNVLGLKKKKQFQHQPCSTVYLSSAKEGVDLTGFYAEPFAGPSLPEKARAPGIRLTAADSTSSFSDCEKEGAMVERTVSTSVSDNVQMPGLSYDGRRSTDSRGSWF